MNRSHLSGGSATLAFRDLFDGGSIAGLDDAELLARFRDRRDEAAFAALVERHGSMVRATARAVLGNNPDADDAFQATFLILARRAGSIRSAETLAPWLHRVAHRSAVASSVAARHRRQREAEAARHRPGPSPPTDHAATLHAEVERLPAPYRAAVVLCDLEGHSYAEAARRLGCTEAALRNRLARARHRLKTSLTRAGIAGALPVATAPVPASLLRATTLLALGRTTGPETARVITQAASKGLLMIKVTGALLAASGLILAMLAVATRAGGRTVAPAVAPAPAFDSPSAVVEDQFQVRGKVVDPSGQPVSGARVTLGFLNTAWAKTVSTVTSPDGRFKLTVPDDFQPKIKADQPVPISASLPGLGLGWSNLTDPHAEVTVRLVPPGPPIEGQILDGAGRPIIDAKIEVLSLLRPQTIEGRPEAPEVLTRLLEEPDSSWMWRRTEEIPVEIDTRTDAKGKFRVEAIGIDRIATLRMTGPTISNVLAYVINRGGPVRKFAIDPAKGLAPLQFQPARFVLTAPPCRIIEVEVRDVESNQPLSNWQVLGQGWIDDTHAVTARALTDLGGRCRLTGLSPFVQYEVDLGPPTGQQYLGAHIEQRVEPGREPVTVAHSARRAVLLRGRVTDKATGRPVAGRVEMLPYPRDPVGPGFRRVPEQTSARATVGADGRFELVVPRWPSVVGFQADDRSRYRTAQGAERLPFFRPRTREIQSPVSDHIQADNYQVLAEVRPPEGAEATTIDLQVDPEGTVELTILGPDGEPLSGSDVAGIGDMTRGHALRQASAQAMIQGLPAVGGRQVSVWHWDRKLAGTMLIAATGGPKQSIRLTPWGEVRGRLVRPDRTPWANDSILPFAHFATEPLLAPHDFLPGAGMLWTDAEGRFHISSLIPGMHYGGAVSQDGARTMGDLFTNLTINPGEARDLGDVVVVPRAF